MATRKRNLTAHAAYKAHQREDRPEQVWQEGAWLKMQSDTGLELLRDLFSKPVRHL